MTGNIAFKLLYSQIQKFHTMNKNLLLPVFIVVAITLKAQITITSFDMPNANDSILVSIVAASDYANVSDPTATGTAFTWDYSALQPNMQQYEKYDAPQDFTTPYNYLFNPFNTSYGRDNYEFSTIPLPNTNISAAYDFFWEDLTKLKQVGAGFIINNIPIPFLYDQDDIIYQFPLTAGSTSSCNYKYGLDIPNTGYYGQSGTRNNLVDGWGTLTTPFGTFQTLRVKSTIDATDTVYNNSLQVGTTIPRPLKYEYKWLANGKKIPVLKIETTVIAGTEAISNVRYIDSTRAGVPQVGIAEKTAFNLNSTVFPNPCVNELTVAYQLPLTTQVKIQNSNVVGKTVFTGINELQNGGLHKTSISTAELAPGIYFLSLQTANYKEVQKIIVTK
jgi:hypothetical protein